MMHKQTLILALVLFVLFGLPFTALGQGGSPTTEATPNPVDSASVEDQAKEYVAGRTYWGRNQYIEYRAGNLPIIISAPHGGYLKPGEIPNRTWGTTGLDYQSQEYTREVVEHIQRLTGKYPHLIINKLHRSKLDANRPLAEAAQGHQWAEQAWYEFHTFIDIAEARAAADWGRGHYFDLHTKDASQSTDVGLLLSSSELNLSNRELNGTLKYANKSSIKNLANTSTASFSDIIRGRLSLGKFLQDRGYVVVPSPALPGPKAQYYYNGGYNTYTHGSNRGGTIDATQVESYYKYLGRNRSAYARALAESIVLFMEKNYDLNLKVPSCQDACPRLYLPIIVN